MARAPVLLPLALLLCGFSWGSEPDPCAEAARMLAQADTGLTEPRLPVTAADPGGRGRLGMGEGEHEVAPLPDAYPYRQGANLAFAPCPLPTAPFSEDEGEG